jgi:Flp pilus assembly pilin Flp
MKSWLARQYSQLFPAGKVNADMKRIRQFLRDESGPTVAEYAVMLACIIAMCVAGVTLVGGGSSNFWDNNHIQLDAALGGGS